MGRATSRALDVSAVPQASAKRSVRTPEQDLEKVHCRSRKLQSLPVVLTGEQRPSTTRPSLRVRRAP